MSKYEPLWNYIKENDSHLREQLSFITEAQKELVRHLV